MKLGLILKITNKGVAEHTAINKDNAWAKYLTDARPYIKDLNGFDGTDKTAIFIKFLGKLGYLICLVKARSEGSGRPNDNTAAWIFIPANIKISGSETQQIIDDVYLAISGRPGIDNKRLEEIFQQEYPPNDVLISAIATLSSKIDGNLAVRYFGKGTDYRLNELLGSAVTQSEYSKYKAVLLLDKSSGITTPAIITDLTSQLTAVCLILPPEKDPKGFQPYIGKPLTLFSKQIELMEGTSVTIVWKKDGYSDVIKTYIVNTNDNNQTPSGVDLLPNDYKIIVYKNWFCITNSENRHVPGCQIFINGTQLINDKTPIPEVSLEGRVKIQIQKKGYEPYEKEFEKLQSPIPIQLTDIVYSYEFIMPIVESEEEPEKSVKAILSIETNYELTKSPIRGYYTDRPPFQAKYGSYNKLNYRTNTRPKIKHFVYGFLLSSVFLISLFFGNKAINKYELVKKWPFIVERQKETTPPKEETTPSKEVLSVDKIKLDMNHAAIKYLESTTEWKKDSLEQYDELANLYEDMNNFDLNQLTNNWSEKLSNSTKFQEIVKVANHNREENWNPKQGKRKESYNPDSDLIINPDRYIDWLSKDQSKETAPTTSNSSISKAKGSQTSTIDHKVEGRKEDNTGRRGGFKK